MIIAIDGPSGSGKSSVSKEIAKRLNILHLDTGAMYRLLGYKLLKDKIDIENEEKIKKILMDLNIKIDKDKFYLDGEDVSLNIRKNEVSIYASKVSKIFEVRKYMVELQRKISLDKDIILDGRDIGTVVFPNADFKFFLTASVEERARRRFNEDGNFDYEKILKDILKRDYEDENRENSPLKKAEDAIEIKTDNLTFEEVINKILKLVGKI